MNDNQKNGSIITAWQMPHPPIVVPEVGRGREGEIRATLEAMRTASDSIAHSGADTIIIISPHAPARGGVISISGEGLLKGDLGWFGARSAGVEFFGNAEVALMIGDEAAHSGIRTSLVKSRAPGAEPGAEPGAGSLFRDDKGLAMGGVNAPLDHGTVVPLYFISKAYINSGAPLPKLVVLSIAPLDNHELYKFGDCIARAAHKSGARVALVTSGDLSHKLTEDGPYGYDPAGPDFDSYILGIITEQNVSQLLMTSEIMLDRSAQCGFYGLLIVYGALGETKEGNASVPRIISYEGTFGVGYAIAQLL